MSARDRGLSVYRDLAGDSMRSFCAVCCPCCCCLSSLCRLPTSWWPLISIPARDMFFIVVLLLGHRPEPSQDQAAGELQAFFAKMRLTRKTRRNKRQKSPSLRLSALPSIATIKPAPRNSFFSTPSLGLRRSCMASPAPHHAQPPVPWVVGKRWPGRMRIGVEITGSRYRCPPHAHHSPPCAACRCDLARWRQARTHKVRRVVREGAAAACNAHYARPLSGTTRMRWR